MNQMMESIRLKELSLMSMIQTRLEPIQDILILGSNSGDPQNSYIYYFIISFIFISHSSGFKILWTAVMSEWINLMLKWIFNDERPYWWSQMVANKAKHSIQLKQFSISCETGPGFPSGHVMVTASVWFCFISELFKYKIVKKPEEKLLIRVIYASLLVVIAFGRIYISAHFPDQCVFGLITGIVVAIIIDKSVDMNKMKVNQHIVMSLIIIFISYSYYQLMNVINKEGGDRSLRLAKKYCFDIKYVKADTTPLYVIWRTSGAMLGIGLGFDSLLRIINKKKRLVFKRKRYENVLKLIVTLLSTSVLVLYMKQSKPDSTLNQNVFIFYVKSFFQFLMIPIVGLLSIFSVKKTIELF